MVIRKFQEGLQPMPFPPWFCFWLVSICRFVRIGSHHVSMSDVAEYSPFLLPNLVYKIESPAHLSIWITE